MSDVKISAKELEELRDAKAKLAALEAGGVDNWDWYDESLKEYWAEKELKEEIRTLIDDLFCDLSTEIDEPAGRNAGYGFREGAWGIMESYIHRIRNLGKK